METLMIFSTSASSAVFVATTTESSSLLLLLFLCFQCGILRGYIVLCESNHDLLFVSVCVCWVVPIVVTITAVVVAPSATTFLVFYIIFNLTFIGCSLVCGIASACETCSTLSLSVTES
jgi:hypothetical protein